MLNQPPLSEQLERAVLRELKHRKPMLDVAVEMESVSIIVLIGHDGQPAKILFRTEARSDLTRRRVRV